MDGRQRDRKKVCIDDVELPAGVSFHLSCISSCKCAVALHIVLLLLFFFVCVVMWMVGISGLAYGHTYMCVGMDGQTVTWRVKMNINCHLFLLDGLLLSVCPSVCLSVVR